MAKGFIFQMEKVLFSGWNFSDGKRFYFADGKDQAGNVPDSVSIAAIIKEAN